jgi:acyl-CoA thioesterase-1
MLLHEKESPSSYTIEENSVMGLFEADPASKRHREGILEVNGKKVPVRLRGPNAQVGVRSAIAVKDIGTGGWETEVTVWDDGENWVAEKVDVTPRVDPRDVDDPALPRVLVIGDSISMNYHRAAKEALEGIANYYRNDGNAGPADRGTACIDLWVGDYEQPGLGWDVIQFNFGLHDLKQYFDEDTQTYGEYQLPLEDYKRNLESVIHQLKKTKAKLVWCTTTPVPNSSVGKWGDKVMGRRKDEDLVFNRAALEVLSQYPEIAINDINTFIRQSEAFDKWREGKDVHFWGRAEQDLVGEAVASNLKRVLKTLPNR